MSLARAYCDVAAQWTGTDRRWLEVGGRTATAEIYDPQSRRFRYAASMVALRASMTCDAAAQWTGLDSGRFGQKHAAVDRRDL